MRNRDLRAALWPAVLSLTCAAQHALAATFCVGSPDELTAALAAAEANGEDNEIDIRTGLYAAPAGGWRIDLLDGAHSIDVVGGFTDEACTQRVDEARTTVLDGGGSVRPLTIETSHSFGAPSDRHITVRRLTFRNGKDDIVGGLKISDSGPIYGGTIVVEGNAFLGNETAAGNFSGIGPALLAATDGPDFNGGTGLVVRNNLFARNIGPSAAAVYLYSNNQIMVGSNTFVGNLTTDTAAQQRVVAEIFTLTGVALSNNIFWGNNPEGDAATYDLRLDAKADLLHNDIEASVGTPGSDAGSLSVDPLFVDASNDNYAFAETALIDAGAEAPPGGISSSDIVGAARVQGARIDIGAYESGPVATDDIFRSGFDPVPR